MNWLCSCGQRYPAEGRADRLCCLCGIRADNAMPSPATFDRQVEILKEIGASPRVVEVAVEAAQRARVTVVASRSHVGQSYHVTMQPDGTLKCTCAAASFGRACRHVREAA